MRALIHIGHQKTGTKSIQKFLRLNRETLRASGVEYPLALKARPPETGRGGYDIGLSVLAGKKDKFENFKLARGIQDSFGSVRRQLEQDFLLEATRLTGDWAVYSFEGLQGLNDRQVRKVRQLFTKVFDDVQIVFFVRRQDRLALSAYSTFLNHGKQRESLFPRVRRRSNLHYYRTAKRWMGAFGAANVHIYRYEDYDDTSRPIKALLSLPHTEAKQEDRRNKGLSSRGMALLKAFNAQIVFEEPFVHLDPAQIKHLRQLTRHQNTGRPALPSKEEAKAFYAQFVRGNIELSELCGDGRVDFFDDDFSTYPDTPFSLNIDLDEAREFYLDLLQDNP